MMQGIQFVIDHWGTISTILFGLSELLGKLGLGGVLSAIGVKLLRPSAQADVNTGDSAQAQVRDLNPKK